jgi:hypothetical protein
MAWYCSLVLGYLATADDDFEDVAEDVVHVCFLVLFQYV